MIEALFAMDTLQTLLCALHDNPQDHTCWLALADCLEETDQPEQAELLRTRLELQVVDIPERSLREAKLRRLLAKGVVPVAPVVTNSIGMELTLIPAGEFWMGSPESEPGRHHDEHPLHRVVITQPFYLARFLTTQEQYKRVMGNNPSHFHPEGEGNKEVRGIDTRLFPVECVSWEDAVNFCFLLSELPAELAAHRHYRLPTEAEWEYACRAGTTSVFCYGDALSSDRANIDGNLPEGQAARGRYLGRTCPIGLFPANAFGIHDMHGNVWEWCADWFDDRYYQNSPSHNPTGPQLGLGRVLRGGGWFYGARMCRSAYRYRYEPIHRHNDFGVRVAMDVKR